MMSREATIRQTIESHLADWDTASVRGDAYGYLGHCVPDETGEYNRNLEFYHSFMSMSEVLESVSIIQEFTLEASRAVTMIQFDEKVLIRYQYPARWKSLLGWLERLVFVARYVRRLVWIETPEGWLCQSDNTISTRVRVRRRL